MPYAVVALPGNQPLFRRLSKERCQLRLLAGRDFAYERGGQHGNARISVARPGPISDPAGRQREVAGRVMWRIWNEHEVRAPFVERQTEKARKIALAIHVGIDYEERFAAEEGQGWGDAPRRL